jgi:hypothetical protein
MVVQVMVIAMFTTSIHTKFMPLLLVSQFYTMTIYLQSLIFKVIVYSKHAANMLPEEKKKMYTMKIEAVVYEREYSCIESRGFPEYRVSVVGKMGYVQTVTRQ